MSKLQHTQMTEIEALILANQRLLMIALALLIQSPLNKKLIEQAEVIRLEVCKDD